MKSKNQSNGSAVGKLFGLVAAFGAGIAAAVAINKSPKAQEAIAKVKENVKSELESAGVDFKELRTQLESQIEMIKEKIKEFSESDEAKEFAEKLKELRAKLEDGLNNLQNYKQEDLEADLQEIAETVKKGAAKKS